MLIKHFTKSLILTLIISNFSSLIAQNDCFKPGSETETERIKIVTKPMYYIFCSAELSRKTAYLNLIYYNGVGFTKFTHKNPLIVTGDDTFKLKWLDFTESVEVIGSEIVNIYKLKYALTDSLIKLLDSEDYAYLLLKGKNRKYVSHRIYDTRKIRIVEKAKCIHTKFESNKKEFELSLKSFRKVIPHRKKDQNSD